VRAGVAFRRAGKPGSTSAKDCRRYHRTHMKRTCKKVRCARRERPVRCALDARPVRLKLVAMAALTPPDSHRLLAAVGWLELGNAREALQELAQITPGNLRHPGVLEVRWQAAAAVADWAEALRVARLLVEVAPDQPTGWLHRAYAARRAPGGGLAEARRALLPAASRFPRERLVAFNLACYACQMGDLPEARKWLRRAFRLGPRDEVRALALEDGDLEALWPELRAGALP